jgi:hypothetical protein
VHWPKLVVSRISPKYRLMKGTLIRIVKIYYF